jgi:hypothetical protein
MENYSEGDTRVSNILNECVTDKMVVVGTDIKIPVYYGIDDDTNQIAFDTDSMIIEFNQLITELENHNIKHNEDFKK